MDCAKACGALSNLKGVPLDYRGFDKIPNPGIPVWLIPTTSGTGSEASYNASFVDTKSNKKNGD